MKLTREDVVYVAELARLDIDEEHLQIYKEQLTKILGYAEKLQEVNTDNVKATAHVLPINNVMREDVVFPSLEREKVLQNAPSHENGCFKVPKVIE